MAQIGSLVSVSLLQGRKLCFSYIGGSYSSCSVQIRGVKLSDAGEYHFRFETDQPLGRWTSPDTITLDVTGRFTFYQSLKTSPHVTTAVFSSHSLMLHSTSLTVGRTHVALSHHRMSSPHGPRFTTISMYPMGELMEGITVTLTCSSDAAPPVESFAWFKGTDQILHLLSLKYTDRGEYFCVARNSLGTDRSRPLLLNVTFPPKNTRVVVTPSRDIREGSYVNLNCNSQANPPASRSVFDKAFLLTFFIIFSLNKIKITHRNILKTEIEY
uniref:Ig-like domain-containing protein n=1 Tax=Neogobius melanostomus TaxID=47308 RepID=A0A8C6SBN6_9GOBI